MPTRLPIDTLIDLAQDRTDQAARRLGELLRVQASAAEKLAMLRQYRDEYLGQLQDRMQAGMSASELRNYQQFIGTLGGAIEQQRRLADQAEARLTQGRTDWQASKRRLGSYDTLAERIRQQQAAAAGKREQRDGDERSALRLRLRPAVLAG
jgi:flagellar FliJ protein